MSRDHADDPAAQSSGEAVKDEVKDNYVHIRLHRHLLQTCYWSHNCLQKRTDIVEILYSKDIDYMTPEGTFDDYLPDV